MLKYGHALETLLTPWIFLPAKDGCYRASLNMGTTSIHRSIDLPEGGSIW